MNEHPFLGFSLWAPLDQRKKQLNFVKDQDYVLDTKNLNSGVLYSNSAFMFPSVFWIILKWN